MAYECHRCRGFTANGDIHECVMDEVESLRQENNKFRIALEKIANDTPENTNYGDPYSEAQHYIDVAKEALE
jgi:rRNA-processing protein FCF1